VIFPISGVEVHPLAPPLVAFFISFFTSMGGVSGAFLILPYQMTFLGYVSPGVSGTNQLYNVVAIPGGIFRLNRDGRMVWPLAFGIAGLTLPGIVFGAWLRVFYLPDPVTFKLFAGFVLLLLGIRLIWDSMSQRGHSVECVSGSSVSEVSLSWKYLRFRFSGKEHSAAVFPLSALCLLVGVVGGAYGIGGGAILSPLLVTLFGLPIHAIAGATLFGTFFTSAVGVGVYQVLALLSDRGSSPDWLLGALFGLGGLVGIYAGSRCQRFISARWIKLILSLCVLIVAATYIFEFFGL
jgi:uncharacterized membrane protein YfcA